MDYDILKKLTGKKLRAWRKKQGLTMQALADITGYEHSTIWRAEHSHYVSGRLRIMLNAIYGI